MRVVEELADNLAKDAIELANKLGNDDIIYETAKVLVATSSTMEEAYMTSIRVRLAERRARRFLEEKAQGSLTRITLPPAPIMCRKTSPLQMRLRGFRFVLLSQC